MTTVTVSQGTNTTITNGNVVISNCAGGNGGRLATVTINYKNVTVSHDMGDCNSPYCVTQLINQDVTVDFMAADSYCNMSFNITYPSPCTPNYQCRQPLDCYEHDINNCPGSSDRQNSACCPPPANNYGCSNGQCLSGYGTLPPGCNNTCTSTNNYGCYNGQCLQGYGTLPAGCNNTCTTPSGWICDPIKCPNDGTNLCISGNCIPKIYAFAAVGGFFLLMLFKR